VSQCSWSGDAEESVVPILPPTTLSTIDPENGNRVSSSHGASIGAAVGGTLGGVVVIGSFAALLYLFCVKPRRRAATVKGHNITTAAIDQSLFHKPELDSQEPQPIQEMEGKRNQWIVEADAIEARLFELPAREDVAAELKGHNVAIEMAVPTPELESPGLRWARQTPLGRWSLVSSPDGTVSAGETEALSPESEVPSEESPKSLRTLLARLPD
jgi:hypothetical protein